MIVFELKIQRLNSIKDTLDTLYEIVEEARRKRTSDNSLQYACVYTKTSQELLENVIASCPKTVNKRYRYIATTPVPKKKHVTFADPLETSGNNTPNHVKHQSAPKTNVSTIPSTGVNTSTTARRSQPKSNTTHNKTFPAKSVPKKKVEEHPRKNKSKLSKMNRVESSTSVRRTVSSPHTSDIVLTDLQAHHTPVVQIVLWYLDSGCSKHMTRNSSRLRNFVKKFIRTVRFGNDHFGAIMGYGDYVIEVAFRKHTCFVRDLDGVDLIKGNRGTNLYTISVEDMMRSSPICLLSKASKNKSWLWHHRLNHLNFGTLNDLARKDLVRSLPRLKFEKDHLCSACQLGKSKKASHKPKMIKTIMEVLHTLHMDLCGPLRVQSINGKKYILVIVDDYSRYVRTDNGTEFVNKDLTDYYESVGITHEKTVSRTPQQIGVVERWNRTLVEAAWTMLIFSKAQLFLWAEVVATACYTQNRSLIHTLHNKTPYELVHDKKPDLSFLRIFGSLCYPTNNSEDLGKLKAKADIGFFVGYAPN
ncbi:retrovirus-related pol polyprotein from transposon TNT 1-94 [Tanacetum coccineum]|uniref:Retrovirus-related pol polyprotein from transposon TNT 1-94 n=1 Tax=Tanacetum coccineum TaxID=301880 RepID=A0ABQ5J7E9_9ASTR